MENQLTTQHEITPLEMILSAVSNSADLDKVIKLLEIKEKWETNEARKAYHKAMTAFKANPPEINKNKKVSYGNTNYKHASLDNAVDKITAELSKQDLYASWNTHQNGKITVTCKITHVLGHHEETSLSADADKSGAKNDIQALGSTISYLERYTLLALTGLATKDMDTDGKVSIVNITEKQLHTLRDLLIAKEMPESKLNEFLGIERLEELPESSYMKAMQTINAAKKVVKK